MLKSITQAVSLIKKLQKSSKINCYASTGAGISKGSGIPTFRGEDGLWEKYDVMEIASRESWIKNPEKLWKLYQEGFPQILVAKPNEAHKAIAKLESKNYVHTIITQNVDSLHQKAGSKNVIELHGNLTKVRCFQCNKTQDLAIALRTIPPKCSCGGMMRPDAIMYNDPMPEKAMNSALKTARKANLVLVIGTSAEVYPAAGLPIISKKNNAKMIVFNPEETEHVQIADVFVQGKCEETLPIFVERLLKE